VLSILLPLVFIVQGGIGLPGGAVYLHPHAFGKRVMQSVAAAVGPAANIVFGAALLWASHSRGAELLRFFATATGGDQHARFWCAVAFLGWLQLTAAVLNLLPIPGLDGYAIIEPYLDPETVRIAEKVKPWGMIGVIVLLQIQRLNAGFFSLVNWIYDRGGGSVSGLRLSDVGHEFFKFWARQPW
jgi:Zn-dependent protease